MDKILLDDYLHKSQRNNGIALHKLYDCEKLIVPTSEQILMHKISLTKYFNDFLKDVDEYEINEDEMMEDIALCNFLGIDYDGIVPYDPSKPNEKYNF